jgi:hypothetical protein
MEKNMKGAVWTTNACKAWHQHFSERSVLSTLLVGLGLMCGHKMNSPTPKHHASKRIGGVNIQTCMLKNRQLTRLGKKTPYKLVIRIISGTTAFLDGGRKLPLIVICLTTFNINLPYPPHLVEIRQLVSDVRQTDRQTDRRRDMKHVFYTLCEVNIQDRRLLIFCK